MIEKYKTGGPQTERPVPLTVLKTSSSLQDKPVAPNHDEYDHDIENGENCVTSLDETETQDLSRRSSLHSSILEVTRSGSPDVSEHTENPLSEIEGAEAKPEVVVTKAKGEEDGKDKIANYLNLIPAPTPTRFVGKMHKVREDKKKLDDRTGSIETITEVAEGETALAKATSDDGNETESRRSSAKSISKIKLGSLVGNVRKTGVGRKESISVASDQASKSTSPSSSTGGGKDLKDSPSSTGSGVATKKKVEAEQPPATKEWKTRLFFRQKEDLTDEEILDAIGAEESPKVVGQSLGEVAHAATFMKKLLDGKKETTPAKSPGLSLSGSVFYVGSLKAKLSKAPDEEEEEVKMIKNPAMKSTVFLGKMISRKDKRGLKRGGSSDEEMDSMKENPIFLALEKVKMKQQTSLDSDSRAASRASKTSMKSNIDFDGDDKDSGLALGETVGSLNAGLLTVKTGNIREWNLHKHVKGDRELKPILIL